MKFVAIRKCYFMDQLWEVGAKMDFSGQIVPCPVCKGKDDKCQKCKGTGRATPPHHFVAVNDAPVAPVAVVAPEPEYKDPQAGNMLDLDRDALRAEIEALEGAYDNRWGVAKLQQALVELKKQKGA